MKTKLGFLIGMVLSITYLVDVCYSVEANRSKKKFYDGMIEKSNQEIQQPEE